MGSHIVDGDFQSDKYPTTPRGKVPLSIKDPTAQDLLWEYAQRRRAVDAEFSDDLEACLRKHGYAPLPQYPVDYAERVRDAVRREVLDRTACVAGWDGFLPGSIKRMADDIANRVADRLTTFEDGGKSERAACVTPPRAGDRLLLIVREGARVPGSGWSPVGIVQGFTLHGMTVTQADLDANHGIAPYDIPVREFHLDGGDITELGRHAAAAVEEVLGGGAVFEDGGKPGSGQTGPRAQATQEGAATPGQGATAQGAVPAAGNVAEPQLGPTTDRAEHPPSSPFAVKIIVNGRPVDFEPAHISYAEIVGLAGLTGTPSVTYCSKRDGDVRREGTMYTGCSPVLVTDVMTFDVVHTGGA